MLKCLTDEMFSLWIKKGIGTLGFKEIGDARDYETKDSLLIRCDSVYANEMPIKRIQIESQLWKFCKETSKKDMVITYRESKEQYYFGIIEETYKYLPEILEEEPNILKINWLEKCVPENKISTEIKNYLNTAATIFQVIQFEDELSNHYQALNDGNDNIDESNIVIQLVKDVYSHNERLIKKLDNIELLIVIRELVKVMNYKIKNEIEDSLSYFLDLSFLTPIGTRSESLKMFIVKDREVMQFKDIEHLLTLGTRIAIFSVEGFAASVANNINSEEVTLLDLHKIVILIFKYYDNFSVEVKGILNLKKVYI